MVYSRIVKSGPESVKNNEVSASCLFAGPEGGTIIPTGGGGDGGGGGGQFVYARTHCRGPPTVNARKI